MKKVLLALAAAAGAAAGVMAANANQPRNAFFVNDDVDSVAR